MPAYDADKTLETLREIVAEFGSDYIYPKGSVGTCSYQRNGAPSCLVGQFLFVAGVSVETLAKMDDGETYVSDETGEPAEYDADGELVTYKDVHPFGDVASLALDFPEIVDDQATAILALAQELQDGGTSWGNTLHEVEKRRRELGEVSRA